MQTLRSEYSRQHRVIAEFEGSALSFALPTGATFEDLAGRLAALGRPHRGAPLRVAVMVGG
jgi:hypothetical protein